MKHHQPAAAFHERLQFPFLRRTPPPAIGQMTAVEVIDHHIEVLQRPPLRIARHLHREPPRTFENVPDGPRSRGPVMIVRAVDDQRRYLSLRPVNREGESKCNENEAIFQQGTLYFIQ